MTASFDSSARPSSANVSSTLFTDLYELTMLEAYFEEQMNDTAVFSLFVRRLPPRRNDLLACGLDDVLSFLETLRFDDAALDYLASLGRFSKRFLQYLKGFRFTGDVYAVPEGTPVFAQEPILELAAPIAEAQLVEAAVMNHVHLQTVLASKAARVVEAAHDRRVVDFGMRRTQGVETSLRAARAFHIAGVAATSNVAAGRAYGLPLSGTLAHSYIQAHDDEYEAFRAFARLYPDTVLLVDTYDTLDGVRKVVALANELRHGPRLPHGQVSLASAREHARQELNSLPKRIRNIEPATPPYDVDISPPLKAIGTSSGVRTLPRRRKATPPGQVRLV